MPDCMGVPYKTAEEIHDAHAALSRFYAHKKSWIVQQELDHGTISREILTRFGTDAAVMEIGCSNGALLDAFSKKGLTHLIGVDIDDYLSLPGLRPLLRVVDLNRAPFPAQDGSLDALIALETFEHLENPWAFARECRRVLKPGGLLVLSMPWGHTVWDKLLFFRSGNLVNYHAGNNHITFLTRDVFAKAFLHFQEQRRIYQHGYVPFLYPRRLRKRLPPHPLWSLKTCAFLTRTD